MAMSTVVIIGSCLKGLLTLEVAFCNVVIHVSKLVTRLVVLLECKSRLNQSKNSIFDVGGDFAPKLPFLKIKSSR